ncbi:MAG: HK97 family phage prohead protease [Terriglobales bacterium]
MRDKQEIRFLASLRAEDGGQVSDGQMTLRGMACTYGTMSKDLGGFRERVMPGAFRSALAAGQDCRCLFNHDASRVLGRVSNGTLKLSDTPEGLAFRCQLDPNNSQHRDLYASVKRGDINACSWAFKLNGENGDDEWDTDTDEEGRSYNRRTIRNVSNLFDVSVVTHPAYEGTSVAARQQALSFEERLFRSTGKYPTHGNVTDAELRAKAILQARQIRNDSFVGCSAVRPVYEEGRDLPVRFEAIEWDEEKRQQRLIDARAERFVASQALLSTAEVNRLRQEVRDVAVDGPGFNASTRCAGGSLTATARDHEAAAISHNVLATKATDQRVAERHYAAAHQHRLAAEQQSEERMNAALLACREAYDWSDRPDDQDDDEGEEKC